MYRDCTCLTQPLEYLGPCPYLQQHFGALPLGLGTLGSSGGQGTTLFGGLGDRAKLLELSFGIILGSVVTLGSLVAIGSHYI